MLEKYLKISALAITLALPIGIGSANAGSTTLSNSKTGQKVNIHCTGSGCSITIFNKSGSVVGSRSSPGGTKNFNKNIAKYRSKGFR